MRDTFIDGLYKVSVSQARMQMVVDGLDPVSTLPSEVFMLPGLCIMMFTVLLLEDFNVIRLLHSLQLFCPCNIKHASFTGAWRAL